MDSKKFIKKKKKKLCFKQKEKKGTSIKLIPLYVGNKDFTARKAEWSRTFNGMLMTTSSSPASSVCVYKLFSSCRVWSRTWCMPRFSSLACDSFSGEKKKYDTVNPQSPVSSACSFHATVISP